MGAQMNCLNEMVLLSTHNICFGAEIRKSNLYYPILRPKQVLNLIPEELPLYTVSLLLYINPEIGYPSQEL